MRVAINDREDYISYVTNHYCKKCGHKDDCPMFYLCPPLQEQWDEEEEFRKMEKRFADEKE